VHDVEISILSDGNSFERQRYLSIHRQQEGFGIKNSIGGRRFAGNDLEAG
jgi:hypothetical protein